MPAKIGQPPEGVTSAEPNVIAAKLDVFSAGNPDAESDTEIPPGPDVGERVIVRDAEVTVKVVLTAPRFGSVTISM